MIFSRNTNSGHGESEKKKIWSDVRPKHDGSRPQRRLPPLEQKKALPHMPPKDENKYISRENVYTQKRRGPEIKDSKEYSQEYDNLSGIKRRRALRFAIVVAIIAGAAYFAYIIWASSLTLIVEQKKTTFDLGSSGIKVTFEAKLLEESVVKRGDGASDSVKNFSEKARGIVIVYNAFNPDSQILIAGTRFSTPEGLIFRSTEKVIVPGKTSTRPGSIDVLVIADQPGPKYNIGLTDFTIPGFAGGPKYEKFYGRSKTEMKGGMVGEGNVITKEKADELLAKLENEMNAELKKNFEGSIGNTFISFPSKFEYSTTGRITDPEVGSPGEKFFGEVRGEARTLALDLNVYSETLAAILFKEKYKQDSVRLHDSSKLAFLDVSFNYEAKTVTMVIQGKAVFEWVLNVGDFKNRVFEVSDASQLTDSFFRNYPEIAKVEAVFQPKFWKKMPKSEDSLIIRIKE